MAVSKTGKKQPAKKLAKPPVKEKEESKLSIIGTPAYYENIIKTNPLDQKTYRRLMVLYRQQKEYKKELLIINKAIKTFEGLYATSKKADKKVNSISSQLNRSLGLVDKKGKLLHELEPLAGWRRRKEVVLKKMGKG